MDDEGLVRLGERLERSPLSYDCRHPIILGKGSHLAALLIRRSHEEVKHFGVNTILCNLRQRYWPIRGKEQVKKILSSCVLCKKWRGNPGVQFMGDLPASRVDFPNPPFTLTGVDYFGPITTKAGFRGGRREKRYGVVFTCLQTRAVHLEVAQSLSTDDLLKPKLQQEGLDWNFNPPFVPHMGGAWEAMVKLAKRAITATTNGAQLTDDELSTVAAECEAMLNNRPLTYVGSDPDDVEPLTPRIS
ncbi:PREDICTED: uncharacterized protein LOC107358620 [Paramuricea clavata]|uniref:PREDICTED: uncharacterized protein LOC107358620 n=1 Tax=Paramuricea clavata TaxID=317549 RepID=A0A7D9L8E5_PARCT|nr:PREDICTED: uncharacterized protein LOC107358620 [Paramuricea clavata]